MKRLIIFSFILGSLALSNLGANAQIVVKVRPAKPKVLVVKRAAPRSGVIFIDGHWKYNKRHGKYVWVKGHWVKKRRGYAYVPGRWRASRGGHVWVAGCWRRA